LALQALEEAQARHPISVPWPGYTFFANADFSSFTGALTGDQTNWVDQNQIQSNADYYQKNYLDANSNKLNQKGNIQVLKLTDDQWDLIQTVELNVFVDDG
jgi:hypothetical protein